MPRFRNLNNETSVKDYIRGWGYQGSGGRKIWDNTGLETPGFGKAFKYGAKEKSIRRDILNSSVEMLKKAGFNSIHDFNYNMPGGSAIHEMGTVRMGRDPKTSVLNSNNQIHEVKNVFITDGSCMTSSAWQNPSLTYMALTARACDFAVNELKKGNL